MVIYTARTPGGRLVTLECASLNQALDLAEADLASGLVPVSIDDADQHYDLDAIIALLDGRARGPDGGAIAP
jgi:hypothetical protein